MSFKRIDEPLLDPENISLLEDRPLLTAAELKHVFDKAGVDIVDALYEVVDDINTHIGELEKASAAGYIGAEALAVFDESAANVQAKLAFLKKYIDDKVIQAGAGDMMKAVYDANNSGVVDNAERLGGLLPAGYAAAAHTHDVDDITEFAENGITAQHFEVTAIAPGTDLDRVTLPGFYRSASAEVSATLSNCPVLGAFFMVVGLHGQACQVLFDYSAANPAQYIRNQFGDGFGDWARLQNQLTSANPLLISSGGTGATTPAGALAALGVTAQATDPGAGSALASGAVLLIYE